MYRKHYSTRKTNQRQPIPGRSDMVRNNAKGYVFVVDDWQRLERFLILGSEGGTYYVSEKKLTVDNANVVARCITENGKRVVDTIVSISDSGRAPKNDPALFALAMCAGMGDTDTRRYALDNLHKVARIGTHLFHFAEYVEGFRGWGRQLKRGIGNWYNNQSVKALAYQTIKYQQRDGWSHRDLLRLSHPTPDSEDKNTLYKYITNGVLEPHSDNLAIIDAFEQAKVAESTRDIVSLILQHNLTREMIPTKWLNEPKVWEALLQKMPLTAIVRNLGKMTKVGLLKPLSSTAQLVVGKLTDQEYIKKSRLHPLNILIALRTYQSSRGLYGSLTWGPVREIIDALDDAFYLSFDNVEPTNKRTMLALDVSGSMCQFISGLPMSCAEAETALALVTANVESKYAIFGFNEKFKPLPISPKQRLNDALSYTRSYNFGATDCALPMIKALDGEFAIDTFVIYTDSETWYGDVHPTQALEQYRQKMGIDSKLIVVGMTSNGFTIADPVDINGQLDVVGFDTSTPQVISNFSRGYTGE